MFELIVVHGIQQWFAFRALTTLSEFDFYNLGY